MTVQKPIINAIGEKEPIIHTKKVKTPKKCRSAKLINPYVKAEMKKILADIQSGKYAKEFMQEMDNGGTNFQLLREKSQNHLIEKIGAEIRSAFSWDKKNKLIDKNKN